MFRTLFAAAFVAAATATTWPMITVNSAGEIVLNSVSRASSFQLTAMSVTAAPTSSTTSSLTTVTALDDNVDTYIVSVPTTLATSGGFKLPTPTVGRKITLFNDGTAPAEFTVWTSATTVFFGTTTSTTHVVPSTATWTTFTATDTTNWAVTSSEGTSKTLQTIGSGSTTAITLTANELLGGFYTWSGSSAATLTTPTGSALEAANVQARVGDSFEFTLYNSGSADVTLTAGASGITFSDYAVIDQGSRVSFRVLRTAASSYTIWRKSNEYQRALVIDKTADFTAAVSESGAIYSIVANAAVAVTLPACTASNVGVHYRFYIDVGANALTIKPSQAGDIIIASGVTTGPAAILVDATTSGTTGVLTITPAATVASNTVSGGFADVACVATNRFMGTIFSSNTATIG